MGFPASWLLPARVVFLILLTVVVAGGGTSVATGATAPTGLVASYSFDAGSGATLDDLSGNGNDGSISGAVWDGDGKNGGALSFDGVDDWVTIADSAAVDLSGAMTLEAWVRPSTADGWRTVVTKETGGNLVYGLFSSSDTGSPAGIATIGGGAAQSITRGPSALPVSTWKHLATTYDGSTLRLYVDGSQVAATPVSGSMANTSGALRLGGNAIWREWFAGEIDDVRVYNRALSGDEIRGDLNTPVGAAADTQPPSTPTGLRLSGQTQTAIELGWNASSDNVGVTGYGRYRDGAIVGSGAGTSHTFTGLACGTSYTLAVDAYDADDNRSARQSITASTSACATPPPSASPPVASYSFDAGSGTNLADSSGRGNNGVISGAAWTSAGKFGGALSFDGADDRVTIADSGSLDLATGMTLEAWVRPSRVDGWRTVVLKERASGLVYALYAGTSTNRPSSLLVTGQVGEARGPVGLPLSTWSHLAASYDGTAIRLYVNGVEVSTDGLSGTVLNSSSPLQIGGNAVWTDEGFQGQIDDVRVYDRALTAGEIRADMAAPVQPPPPSSPGDTQPPTVPGGLGVSSVSQSAVSVSWSAASDNVGVAGYGLYRAGALVGTGTGTSSTFSGLACGTSYVLAVDAFDAAGNRSAKATVSASTSVCSSSPPPPPPPTGGATILPGQSWQTAYNAAAPGSTLNVAAGNHGAQRLAGSKAVTFLGASGATLASLWNDASSVTLDNVDIDGNAAKVTILEEHGSNNTYKNLEIRDNTDVQMVGNHGSNPTFDNVFFHDAVMTTAGENSGVHMECVYSKAPGSTFRNSTFKDCAVMDLFLTRGSWYGQANVCCITLENNIFYPSERTNNGGVHYYSVQTHDNADSIDRYVVKNNRFDLPFNLGNNPVIGSVFCGNSGQVSLLWVLPCL